MAQRQPVCSNPIICQRLHGTDLAGAWLPSEQKGYLAPILFGPCTPSLAESLLLALSQREARKVKPIHERQDEVVERTLVLKSQEQGFSILILPKL